MATQYGFYIELERCVNCHACEVACKQVHDTPAGVRWRRVIDTWGGDFPDVSRTFVSLSCMHCGNPACEAVCPTGAISKRAEDGIVVVDQNKCIGCHYCFFACPFGIPQYGTDGTMQKCDFCTGLGIEPACAATCIANALHAGTLEELSEMAQKKAAEKLAGSTIPSAFFSF